MALECSCEFCYKVISKEMIINTLRNMHASLAWLVVGTKVMCAKYYKHLKSAAQHSRLGR